MAHARTILLAEDDENQFQLMKLAFGKIGEPNLVRRVRDGVEVIQYLKGESGFSDRDRYPFPSLLLLDIQMPLKDGFEVLGWIRSQPPYRRLIVAFLTSSSESHHIAHAYDSCANSYLVKPPTFEGLVRMVKALRHYWLEMNAVPQFRVEEPLVRW